MVYDPDDTIVAVGTAPGGAFRGMIRLSGPQVVSCLKNIFRAQDQQISLSEISKPTVIPGFVAITYGQVDLPCDLYLWPTQQSYTRQPSAELHTLGSPPLLQDLMKTLCDNGTRMAQPGEFTLRAFLAGRLDLTQAEAVLGVIDAQDTQSLHASLAQLAGGLSKPLTQLREDLLQLLAELEAGLDFVEEDIEFISRDQVRTQLESAQQLVSEVSEQISGRESTTALQRVVLSGLPNAGKSSLFNALVQRYGVSDGEHQALVSEHAGTTRDFVSAALRVDDLLFELADTAGIESSQQLDSIEGLAQKMTESQRQHADLVLRCLDASAVAQTGIEAPVPGESLVLTKSDLIVSMPHCKVSMLACCSQTGFGLSELVNHIHSQLSSTAIESASSSRLTATRCNESLASAQFALTQALQLVESQGGDELIAAEIRNALHALGQVVGTVYTDDILDRIFGQFCIGK